MNITMLHDIDAGFMAATLKPAFEKLGHTCTVLQTLTTYMEADNTSHIDHLLSTITMEGMLSLKEIYKETDLFILRSVTDYCLKVSGVLPYVTPDNTIYRVHGSEMRDNQNPYTSRTWRINWHNREPVLVGPRDPSLFHLYRENTITHIERPCAFDIFPRKRRNKKNPFAVTTPSNIMKKGTQSLIDTWNSPIPLHVLQGVSRQVCLKYKSQASYNIDNIGSGYPHGPYHMNTVEAWYYRIPTFFNYLPMDEVVCPELPDLCIHSTEETVQHNLDNYEPDKKQLAYARKYALHTHDPMRIAKQYTKVLEQ